MNISQLLFNSAETYPSEAFIFFRNQSFSYEAIADQVKRKAVGFREYGIKDRSHVGLMMGNKPEYVIAYFSLLSLGATVIPINPAFKESEITYILNDSEAEAVIADEIAIEAVLKALPPVSTVKTVFSLRKEKNCVSWEDVNGMIQDFFLEDKGKEDPAQIIYTSGTTGKPKGAIITHSNLDWMSHTCAEMSEVTKDDRILVVLPIFHAYAKLQGIWQAVYKGSKVYLEERFVADEILNKIAQKKITIFLGVPTMYTLFLSNPSIKELDFTDLRIAGCGGANLPLDTLEKVNEAMGVQLKEGYGQTESTVMISCFPPGVDRKYGSVGLPLPGIELQVIDPNGREVPAGEVGEIIFRGPNAMSGYYKKEQETSETIRGGWVFTGDLAKRDEQGYLYIVDRKKDMIIRGGYNVYPREIEETLYNHPNIIECAVLGESDPVFGEEIAAYVVTKIDTSTEEIIAFCKQHLAHYKVPRKVYLLDSLPKNATGKILKAPLKNRSFQ
ncbi:class I adenylate-forming enzyme family protein [Cytobacillus purgationiresistens]|uniref:Long-chain acyl-CoA synthetase n=1 Tax=Cytobacillus purgationiresistens TaxID=863449 RepID=A0ABU0AH81_9BACI|nr:AMP-binding protein [Cytobacillus purgationiresistens]MDQ0270405.1 long-chain acyl-CoA synthetase [Cytobacillus purgationiresistens]